MPTESFVFPGHTAYLEAAAAKAGHPDLARAAGRQVALTSLANLCAQASRAEPASAGAILARAAEFRDQLAIALDAAEAMLADVGAPTTRDDVKKEASVSAIIPRKAAKGRVE